MNPRPRRYERRELPTAPLRLQQCRAHAVRSRVVLLVPMARDQIKIALDPQLRSQLDEERGDVSRSRWVARAIETHIVVTNNRRLAALVKDSIKRATKRRT